MTNNTEIPPELTLTQQITDNRFDLVDSAGESTQTPTILPHKNYTSAVSAISRRAVGIHPLHNKAESVFDNARQEEWPEKRQQQMDAVALPTTVHRVLPHTPLPDWHFGENGIVINPYDSSVDSKRVSEHELRQSTAIQWRRERIQEERKAEKKKSLEKKEPPEKALSRETDLALKLSDGDRAELIDVLGRLDEEYKRLFPTATSTPFAQTQQEITNASASVQKREADKAEIMSLESMSDAEKMRFVSEKIIERLSNGGQDMKIVAGNINQLIDDLVTQSKQDPEKQFIQTIVATEVSRILEGDAVVRMGAIREKYKDLATDDEALKRLVMANIAPRNLGMNPAQVEITPEGDFKIQVNDMNFTYTRAQVFDGFVTEALQQEVYERVYQTPATTETRRLEEASDTSRDEKIASFKALYGAQIVDMSSIGIDMSQSVWDMISSPECEYPKNPSCSIMINPRSEHAPMVLKVVHQKLADYNRTHPDKKIRITGDILRPERLYPTNPQADESHLRPDKINLYFEPQDVEVVFQIMKEAHDEISSNNPEALSSGRIPYGAGQIMDDDGHALNGFAFAERRKDQKGIFQEHGGAVSHAIAKYISSSILNDRRIDDANFQEKIAQMLAEEHRDPEHPYLLDPSLSTLSPDMRKKVLSHIQDATASQALYQEKVDNKKRLTRAVQSIAQDAAMLFEGFDSLSAEDKKARLIGLEERLMQILGREYRAHEESGNKFIDLLLQVYAKDIIDAESQTSPQNPRQLTEGIDLAGDAHKLNEVAPVESAHPRNIGEELLIPSRKTGQLREVESIAAVQAQLGEELGSDAQGSSLFEAPVQSDVNFRELGDDVSLQIHTDAPLVEASAATADSGREVVDLEHQPISHRQLAEASGVASSETIRELSPVDVPSVGHVDLSQADLEAAHERARVAGEALSSDSLGNSSLVEHTTLTENSKARASGLELESTSASLSLVEPGVGDSENSADRTSGDELLASTRNITPLSEAANALTEGSPANKLEEISADILTPRRDLVEQAPSGQSPERRVGPVALENASSTLPVQLSEPMNTQEPEDKNTELDTEIDDTEIVAVPPEEEQPLFEPAPVEPTAKRVIGEEL